jgi:hypothetical protein
VVQKRLTPASAVFLDVSAVDDVDVDVVDELRLA